jgi:hypothetical protein
MDWVDPFEICLVVLASTYATIYTLSVHPSDYKNKKECTCEPSADGPRGSNGLLTVALMYDVVNMEMFVLAIEVLSLLISVIFAYKYVTVHWRLGSVIKELADGEAYVQEEIGRVDRVKIPADYRELPDILRKQFTPLEAGVSLGLRLTKQIKMWFGVFIGVQATLNWTGFAIVLSQYDMTLEIGTDVCICPHINESLFMAMVVKIVFFTFAMGVCGWRLSSYAADGLGHKIKLLVDMARGVSPENRRKIAERYVRSLRTEGSKSAPLTGEEERRAESMDTDLIFADMYLVSPLRSDI